LRTSSEQKKSTENLTKQQQKGRGSCPGGVGSNIFHPGPAPGLFHHMASGWGRKGVQRTQSREGERFIINEPNVHVWNIDGSSSDQLCSGSWIRKWEEEAGQIRGRCAYQECERSAAHGGHVWIKGKGVYLVPLCAHCNSPRNPDRMQNEHGDHSHLKLGVVAVGLGPLTEDMRRCERRISTDSSGNAHRGGRSSAPVRQPPRKASTAAVPRGGRPGSGGGRSSGAKRNRAGRCCKSCNADIADHPPSHKMCSRCFAEDSSSSEDDFPRCDHCGKDISDRPMGHTVCYACYCSSSTSGGGRSSGAKRKRAGRCCKSCNADIADRPPSHKMCSRCFAKK
jgi:hypothetical protein